MNSRPNIVLTIADDQRWDTIAALGNREIITPNLDRLADRGTSFLRAQHGGSTHGAVCAPSRAQLHTGRSLFHTCDSMTELQPPVTTQRIGDPDRPIPTLGQRLSEGGYDTFGVGKWHNGEASFLRSFNAGRSVFFGGMCPHFCVVASDLEPGQNVMTPPRSRAGHSTEIFSRSAVDFILSRTASDRPFFLYVAFTAPHDPRETHHRFRRLYDRRPSLPDNFLPKHPWLADGPPGRDESLAEFPRGEEEIRMHLADYYAMITHLDEGIGAIHTALAEAGLADNTIVSHTADHGLSVGQHGLMGKQNLYDASTRVPLIIAGPGMAKGETDRRLCYQHDLHPTLLSAAGIEAPSDFIRLDSGERRSSIGCAYSSTTRSVRDERLKLVETRRFAAGSAKDISVHHTELFDTSIDPAEVTNLLLSDTFSDSGSTDGSDDSAASLERGETPLNDSVSTTSDSRSELPRMRRLLREHLNKTDDPLLEVFSN